MRKKRPRSASPGTSPDRRDRVWCVAAFALQQTRPWHCGLAGVRVPCRRAVAYPGGQDDWGIRGAKGVAAIERAWRVFGIARFLGWRRRHGLALALRAR